MPADLDLHLRPAGSWDNHHIVDVLTSAVAATSIARWILPTAQTRARYLQRRLTQLITSRIAAGKVRVAEHDGQIIGAIAWTTCTETGPTRQDHGHALLLDTAADGHRTRQLRTRLNQRHPTRPHHHLLAIGVHPARRRQGIGKLLLHDWHRQLPTDPAPVFLLAPDLLFGLASSAGYHTLGHPISAMISAPPLYVMWRPTNGPAPALCAAAGTSPMRTPTTRAVTPPDTGDHPDARSTRNTPCREEQWQPPA
ncbi:GNAT family N-acetyltransferase [Paractinoplanes globisporus]|uniref:GNAT family N-acetyltransferase n=1 Tax=Paractinoplanes globisporus TaxID=113565 RepID=A0ABW6WF21_9ACTN|nr:GNAT family N-acetyltransferase [Actinoplanes globisporus]